MGRFIAIFRLLKIIKEIRIYLSYRSTIKEEKDSSPFWVRLKLRYDWLGRIYTVVNLPPEVTMSRDFPQDARPAYVFEELRGVNDYLTKLGLQELITPTLKPIAETNGDSYLVIYYFFFRHISWGWIFRFLIELILIGLAAYNYEYIVNLFW